MERKTFPVTITGVNVTERNTNLPTGKGPFDKAGITIQETNVHDEQGNNLVIPAGTWLNGICPPGKLDSVAAGQQIAVTISAKPKNDGSGFWYNFGYFPPQEAAPAPTAPAQAAQAVPVPQTIAPSGTADPNPFVTRQEFEAAVANLQNQITEVANDIAF